MLERMIKMNDALARTWSDIRERQRKRSDERKIPAAVVAVGREKSCGAIDWNDPVILLGPATLGSGKPEDVLHALLHQAAHGLVGSVPVRSEGRWHDSAYQAAAEHLGLEIIPGPSEGWHNSTVMPDATRDKYPRTLATLAAALADDASARMSRSARNGVSAQCNCNPPRMIRVRGSMAIKDLKDRPIQCTVCGSPFSPVETSQA